MASPRISAGTPMTMRSAKRIGVYPKVHLDNGRAKKKVKALQGVEAAAAAAALGSPGLSKIARGHPDESSRRHDGSASKCALIQISSAPSPHRFPQGVVLWEDVEHAGQQPVEYYSILVI